MVSFERLAGELRSLYQAVQELEPGPLLDIEARASWRPAERREILSRYDELLAGAAAMLGAACPPLPFTLADRLWLEEALVGVGLDVRASSARGSVQDPEPCSLQGLFQARLLAGLLSNSDDPY